jgi:hypothetical protein
MRVQRIVHIMGAWLMASFLATEVFAWTRGFHPGLGAPLMHAGVWPVYHPLTIWRWLWAWGWSAPGAFREAGIAFAIVFLGLMIAAYWPKPPGKPQAQWSNRRNL